MGKYKILVADDEAYVRQQLKGLLEESGYEVFLAKDGDEAINIFFEEKELSLVILDVMMPKENGWVVLEEIRKLSNIPILILTALNDDKNLVYGLDHGANDYIGKPFNNEVFLARIRVLLRTNGKNEDVNLTLGDITINTVSHSVVIGDKDIYVNNKEFRLLLYLMKNKGRVLSRSQILNHVWGYDYEGSDRTVDTHIKMLRAKIKPYEKYIKTVRGNGYLLEPCPIAES